jgi:hypothetical protein
LELRLTNFVHPAIGASKLLLSPEYSGRAQLHENNGFVYLFRSPIVLAMQLVPKLQRQYW